MAVDVGSMLQALGQLGQANALRRNRREAADARKRQATTQLLSTAGSIAGGTIGAPFLGGPALGSAIGGAAGTAVGSAVGGQPLTGGQVAQQGANIAGAFATQQANAGRVAALTQTKQALAQEAEQSIMLDTTLTDKQKFNKVETLLNLSENKKVTVPQFSSFVQKQQIGEKNRLGKIEKQQKVTTINNQNQLDIEASNIANSGETPKVILANLKNLKGSLSPNFKGTFKNVSALEKEVRGRINKPKKLAEFTSVKIIDGNKVTTKTAGKGGDILTKKTEPVKKPKGVEYTSTIIENLPDGGTSETERTFIGVGKDAELVSEKTKTKPKKPDGLRKEKNTEIMADGSKRVVFREGGEIVKTETSPPPKKADITKSNRAEDVENRVVVSTLKRRDSIEKSLTTKNPISGEITPPSQRAVDEELKKDLTTLVSSTKGVFNKSYQKQLDDVNEKIITADTTEAISKHIAPVATVAEIDNLIENFKAGDNLDGARIKEALKRKKAELLAESPDFVTERKPDPIFTTGLPN